MRLIQILAVLLIAPGLSFGGFVDNREDHSSVQQGDSPLVITGFSSLKKEVVGGMGRDMPIKSAIEQITPKAYTVIFKSIWDDKVSWQGGVDWTDILATVASTAKMSVIIDTDKQTVTVQRSQSGVDSNGTSDYGSKGQLNHTLQMFIRKGRPINEALESWATAAGWTLLWYPSVSWKAIADVDMSDRRDVSAAVSEVISILREEGKPVQLRISEGNKVMEVISTEVKND